MALRLLRSLFSWCGKGFFNRPACLDSSVQRLIVDSNFGSPVLQAESFSLKCNHSSVRAIEGLLSWRCPSAVRRPSIRHAFLAMTTRIAFRAIDSVIAVRWRRLGSHIGVEALERRPPSSAYRFAVSSVGWKVLRVRIVASSFHFLPRNVFRAIAKSVSSIAACSATIGMASSQVGPNNRLFFSALTPTKPMRPAATVWHFVQYAPLTESLPSQIFEVRVPPSRITVSHDFVTLKQVVVRTASQLQLIGCLHFSTFAIGGPI
jgi:hypothetical protein